MNASASISSASDRRASEDLGLWEPKRALTLEAARAHTKRINLLRFILMGFSAALVAILIWQFLSGPRTTIFDENDPTESVKMVQPRYSGRTGDGLPFYLIADTAIRRMKTSNIITLDKPILKFNRSENVESSAVIAEDGSYNDIDKILNLRRDVNLETDDGNICDTQHARIFNVEKRIEGDEAITCVGEFGTVNGQSYSIEDDYKTFIFKDGMTADLTQNENASEEDSTFGFGGDGPIDVNARKGIYQGDRTDLRGDVRVEQDGAVITSDKMDIFRVKKSDGSETGSVKFGAIRRIVATGNFHFKSDTHDIRGTQGIYERNKNIMTVTGDVFVIESSGKRVRTQKLTYNTKSGTILFSGKCLGDNCAGNGRTRIVISSTEN